jgi:hypothetical protein
LDMGHILKEDHTKERSGREENQKLECGWYTHCRGANTVILNWQRPL